jgi:RNA polymerase sigma-54 factor
MKISLAAQQTQSLILSPQLQQSLAILQAPLCELQALATRFAEDNPCVEMLDREMAEEEILFRNDKAEPPVDMQWTSLAAPASSSAVEEFPLENNPGRGETLEEYLSRELTLAGHDTSVISLLDHRGYFLHDPDILSPSQREALRFIRTLEPRGLGALGLADCLCLQLDSSSLAYKILQEDEDLFTRRQIPVLAKKHNVTFTTIENLYRELRSLNHNPGAEFSVSQNIPKDAEIFLLKDGTIEIPGDRLPIFKINNNILSRLQYMNAEDREYIREKVKAGKFLIRSITQRQSTLHKVSVAIVNYQKTFLTTYNIHDLKPLTMAQIALECEIHETTVSRAVNNKYLSTPKGTFELRFFFTGAIVSHEQNTMQSNLSIKNQIAEIISREDKSRPLSDEDIVVLLKNSIARRTVAKYRAELSIQPSHLRKTYVTNTK